MDHRIRNNVAITEIGSYKSFTISLYPISIHWIRATFETLMATARTNRFFLEQRFDDYIVWVEKTSNKKGYVAEIYRLDDRGRKCCILVPEGEDKKGWATFHNMLIFKENKFDVPRVQKKGTFKAECSRNSRSFAEVVSSESSRGNIEGESSDNDSFSRKNNGIAGDFEGVID